MLNLRQAPRNIMEPKGKQKDIPDLPPETKDEIHELVEQDKPFLKRLS
jgi:hypothetical protein